MARPTQFRARQEGTPSDHASPSRTETTSTRPGHRKPRIDGEIVSGLVAILEDDPRRASKMSEVLGTSVPGVELIFFDNAPDMIEWLSSNLPSVRLLCLDHDLGPSRERDGERFDPGIGRDVVGFLEERTPTCPVVIHSSNGPAADGMFYALQFAEWAVDRVTPYQDLEWVTERWIGRIVSILS